MLNTVSTRETAGLYDLSSHEGDQLMEATIHKSDALEVEDHKTVTIIVEGTPYKWAEEYISYEQVVTLEVPDYSQHPEITYTVRFKEGPRGKPEGTLSRGSR